MTPTTPQRVAAAAAAEYAHREQQRAMLLSHLEQYPTAAARFVREHGRWFTPQARPIGLRKMKDKACYYNAGRHVLKHTECLYAEGWAMSSAGFVVPHAWAVDDQDRVIDRTWSDPEHCLYFGVAVTVTDFANLMHGQRAWSLFQDGIEPVAGLTELLDKGVRGRGGN